MLSIMFAHSVALADCVFPPTHTFEMKVYRCQAASFGANLLDNHLLQELSDAQKQQTGMVISGYVAKNNYSEDGADFLKSWQDESDRTVFVLGDAAKDCEGYLNKTTKFERSFPCCDTLPATGICLVPLAIASEIEN